MRVFIAGIMQGSRRDSGVDAQDYRLEIAEIVQRHVEQAEVIDPLAMHPDSVVYSPQKAKQTLLDLISLASQADVLVAYVPSASMGTALEMWNAYQSGARVYAISPMEHNWVVCSLSDRVFPDIQAFATFAANGGLNEDIRMAPKLDRDVSFD